MSSGWVALPGRRAVMEALRAGKRRILKIHLQRDGRGGIRRQILEAAAAQGVEVAEAERKLLDELAGEIPHQGVVALAEPSAEPSLEELLPKLTAAGAEALVVVLDELKDPQNVGAIVRTAEAAGAQGVVMTRHRSAPAGRGVERASAGASEHLPIVRVANLRDALVRLKRAGLWVVGADAGARASYTRSGYGRPLALVLGEEGRGLRDLTRRECDELVRIPLKGRVESLNVAAAAAVLCFEVLRQRFDSRKIEFTEAS